MSNTLPLQVTGCTIGLSVGRLFNGQIYSHIVCELPGMERYQREHRGNVIDPQEASSFYDDTLHELKSWSQMLAIALEDLCFNPPDQH